MRLLLLFSHSVMSDCLQSHGLHAARQASLSFTISWSLLKLISVEWMMPSNCLMFCRPLLLLPSIFHSIRVFSNVSALQIKLLKYWSFSFSSTPSNEYSRLLCFRMDWFDLLAVQGILKSLLQSFVETRIDLESVIQSEVSQKNKCWVTNAYMWNLENDIK